MFKIKDRKQSEKESSETDSKETQTESGNTKTNSSVKHDGSNKKGKPTPKRKTRQEENSRPIVPKDRKKARKQRQAENRQFRKEYYQKQSRDLMPRDKGPVKKYIRDFIDARNAPSEWFMIFAVVALVLTFMVGAGAGIYIYTFLMMIIWFYMFLVIGDVIFLALKLRKLLKEKFGAERLKEERGLNLYIISRTLQPRRLRLPKPSWEKRGHYPK